jgi:hypothetical protein
MPRGSLEQTINERKIKRPEASAKSANNVQLGRDEPD